MERPNARDQLSVVLTDLMMPVMDGMTMVVALRQKNLSLKVIVMSGHPAEPQMLDKMQTQCDAFLAKPFSVVQLLQTMRRVIQS